MRKLYCCCHLWAHFANWNFITLYLPNSMHCGHANEPNNFLIWTDFYFPNKSITKKLLGSFAWPQCFGNGKLVIYVVYYSKMVLIFFYQQFGIFILWAILFTYFGAIFYSAVWCFILFKYYLGILFKYLMTMFTYLAYSVFFFEYLKYWMHLFVCQYFVGYFIDDI